MPAASVSSSVTQQKSVGFSGFVALSVFIGIFATACLVAVAVPHSQLAGTQVGRLKHSAAVAADWAIVSAVLAYFYFRWTRRAATE